MTPAEFFVAVYDMLELQTAMTEAYKNKAKDADTYNQVTAEYNALRAKVYQECHKCDNKSQKTFYLMAKEKIQAMNKLKDELGAERV